ncbi:MAG: hypothetical protein ACREX8_10060 [Gammaproteobacteria bacterium]
MPNGIFPVPESRSNPNRGVRARPSLAVRIRTRWRRNRLDQQLARGPHPANSDELSLRAAQLGSRGERSRLADALVETVGDAGRPEPVTIKARPQRIEVLKYADDLLALVGRLRDDEPIDVRGAAMTARLVDDAASPLHRDGGQNLQHAIRAARVALDATGPTTQDLATAA